ncbi:MAG: glycosyltransferase family 2 protein [Candidatus Coatesbacteria bacterium]|nr:MAG: glycosyltransferase family 2 protein [Candidatus Coatesbacteria bacterium]
MITYSKVISTPDLSVLIIAKNEEENLRRCLSNLPNAGEVILVDNGSVDRTKEVAEVSGVRVYDASSVMGFASLRRMALSKANCRWVLFIDADEVISRYLRDEIQNALLNKRYSAFKMPRMNMYFGRFLRFGGFYPDWQVRLFEKVKGNVDDKIIHERFIIHGKVGTLNNPIIHYSYPTLKSYLYKQRFYVPLMAEEMRRLGVRTNFVYRIYRLFLKPFFRFVLRFFLKLGVFDGWQGLFACLFDARVHYLSYREYLRR